MFDDSQVKAILQRAIELDSAKGGKLTHNELVQVASEVGVSRESLEQAIAEQTNDQSPRAMAEARPVQLSVLRLLNLGTAIGIAGGLLASSGWIVHLRAVPLAPTIVGTLCFGALIMLSGGLALADPRKRLRRYLEENTGIWLGFGFGSVLAGGLIAKFGSVVSHPGWVIDSGLSVSAIGFILTSLLGTTLFTVRRMSQLSSDTTQPSSTAGPGSPPSFISRTSAAVQRWLMRVWPNHTTRSSSALQIATRCDRTPAF